MERFFKRYRYALFFILLCGTQSLFAVREGEFDLGSGPSAAADIAAQEAVLARLDALARAQEARNAQLTAREEALKLERQQRVVNANEARTAIARLNDKNQKTTSPSTTVQPARSGDDDENPFASAEEQREIRDAILRIAKKNNSQGRQDSAKTLGDVDRKINVYTRAADELRADLEKLKDLPKEQSQLEEKIKGYKEDISLFDNQLASQREAASKGGRFWNRSKKATQLAEARQMLELRKYQAEKKLADAQTRLENVNQGIPKLKDIEQKLEEVQGKIKSLSNPDSIEKARLARVVSDNESRITALDSELAAIRLERDTTALQSRTEKLVLQQSLRDAEKRLENFKEYNKMTTSHDKDDEIRLLEDTIDELNIKLSQFGK